MSISISLREDINIYKYPLQKKKKKYINTSLIFRIESKILKNKPTFLKMFELNKLFFNFLKIRESGIKSLVQFYIDE